MAVTLIKYNEISKAELCEHLERVFGIDVNITKQKEKKVEPVGWSLKEAKSAKSELPFMVDPLFKKGEVIIMVAHSKVGKSFLALDLAGIVAGGGTLCDRLSAPKPHGVVYFDAEMTQIDAQIRAKKMFGNSKNLREIEKNLTYINILENRNELDILNRTDQEWVEELSQDASLIILDNYGLMIPSKSENNPSDWRKVYKWFKSLNLKGKTVLLVHHLNKSGTPYGTGKMSAGVDLELNLRSPYRSGNKTIIEVQMFGARHLSGGQKKSFIIEYHENEDEIQRRIVSDDVKLDTHGLNLILEKITTQYTVDALQKEMLKTLLSSKDKCIYAGLFKESKIQGSGTSSITTKLKALKEMKLLHREGKGRGTKYIPGPALLSIIERASSL